MTRITNALATTFLTAVLLTACSPVEPPLLVNLETVVTDGKVVPANGLSAAGQPDQKSLKIFANSGYKTVIDMRGVKEDRGIDEQSVVAALGMQYITLPIEDGKDISFENARKLDHLISNAKGPILLHCGSGNRVGALLALRESLHGADDATAIEFGKKGGLTRLEPVVQEVLKQANPG